VGRRHVYQARRGRNGIDHDPLLVHRNAAHHRTEAPEQPSRRGVPRVLEGHFIPRRHEHLGDEIDRLLCPARDGDVVGRRVDAARQCDLARNRHPEAAQAAGVGVDREHAVRHPERLRRQLPPTLPGEQGRVRQARSEIVFDSRSHAQRRRGRRVAPVGRGLQRSTRPGGVKRDGRLDGVLGNERSRTHPAPD
jgi:hypothetical protein